MKPRISYKELVAKGFTSTPWAKTKCAECNKISLNLRELTNFEKSITGMVSYICKDCDEAPAWLYDSYHQSLCRNSNELKFLLKHFSV